ncbi:SAM-dependent chlorinase/fluorinase [Phytoactinopolyspora endophytica]|uniref:SAM hydrolase/SAM-dependent halogenase family protein n=1 Tax=Phytoactinopolyspora endophytica TaxID=1642495 RepID=UPI00101D1900
MAFLTDYGQYDGFVAACHGVAARIAPDLRVIDVTHAVPPQDIRRGAVVLAQTVPYLPPSVVVGVVDPGVGSERRGIAVAAGDHVLIGPDNGLLPWAADVVGGISEAVELAAPEYRLGGDALTFHGRDIFAPTAAHVAAGVPLSALGPALSVGSVNRLPEPRVRVRPGTLETEVHSVDRFGNVELAGRADDLVAAGISAGGHVDVVIESTPDGPGRQISGLAVGRIFADVSPGELIVYVDSYGHVALAVNQGDAAAQLMVEPGNDLTLTASGR